MKIALVHDYLNEFGGAERVLKVMCEMYPDAPIYTAFAVEGSTAWKEFSDRKIVESKLAPILKWKKMYSPLRFLTPWVWEGFDFSEFDVVLSSASWYITKGIVTPKKTKHICYCHTPPRYLYGYPTAIEWQRYWPIRIYAGIVNHYLRKYDYLAAQRVDEFLVNSDNVKKRVRKFYGRSAEIVYPPVEVEKILQSGIGKNMNDNSGEKDQSRTAPYEKKDYYLIVSRVVGAKGIDMAMEAARKMKFKLKIVGEPAGLRWEESKLEKLKSENIEFVGRVDDVELYNLYAGAKAFFALAEDEDFGMTVVEAQAAGTPIIAYFGGGYKETVVDGKTGVFFNEYNLQSFIEAIKKFEKMKFDKNTLIEQAMRFSKKVFMKKIRKIVGE